MNEITMTYRGFPFSVNPQELTVEYGKKTASHSLLKKAVRVQEICVQPTVVNGTGLLTGDRAQQQANALIRIFREEGSATLFSPVFPPMKMLFTQLQLHADAASGGIAFRFRFTEEQRTKKATHSYGYTYAKAGDNLYTIANRCGVPVEELFACNGFRDLFSVNEGDRVWLK